MKLTLCSFPAAIGLAGITMFVAGCGEEPVAPEQNAQAATTASATATGDRYLVLLKEGKIGALAPNVLAADMARLGGQVERAHTEIGVMQVRMTAQAAAQLAKRSDVEAVAKDRTVQWLPPGERISGQFKQFEGQSNQRGAAFFSEQWNLRKIQAPKAWDISNQGQGVLVCILDTGVDPRHIDLEGKFNFAVSASFVGSERADRDFNLHGTAMASAVATNGIGIGSVAPDARLCSVKVLGRDGSGSFSDVTAGIKYVGDVGTVEPGPRIQVANMSLGALLPANDPEVQALATAMQRAVNYSTRRGVLFVAAAGNESADLNNTNLLALPAMLNNVISVGATGPIDQQRFDHIAHYSNEGRRGVDVFAPGGEFGFPDNVVEDLILMACSPSTREPGFEACASGNRYLFAAGTSPSAAYVSGEAAEIESELAGNQTPAELTECILETADPLGNPLRTANGRINVLNGVQCGSTSQNVATSP